MKNAKVIFGPEVNAAILALIDYVELNEIPAVLGFLERIQERLVTTLSALPEYGLCEGHNVHTDLTSYNCQHLPRCRRWPI